jgi:hypothetical protein
MPNSVSDYIRTRVLPRLEWYDRRAVFNKRLYSSLQYFSVVVSIVLVLLIENERVPRGVLAVLAALGGIAVTVERVGRFGQLWNLYRLAAEAIYAQLQLYSHQAGIYAVPGATTDALFVERMEALLAAEASHWESVTLAGRTTAEERSFPSS